MSKRLFTKVVRRLALGGIAGAFVLMMATAGARAAGFSLLGSVSEFFGKQPGVVAAEPAAGDRAGGVPADLIYLEKGQDGGPVTACIDVPYGVFTPEQMREYYNAPTRLDLMTKTEPAQIESGDHQSNILTIVLDFKTVAQGSTVDMFGNTVTSFDPTTFGFASGDFNTVAASVLDEVEQDYFAELTGTAAGPAGQDLQIDFVLGDIGTPPPGRTNYYYMQIGTGTTGPHTGGLGVACVACVRTAAGAAGGAAVGQVIGSIFTDNIQSLGGLSPGTALTSGNLGFTTFAISGTTAHEAGHSLSLSHINKAASVQPTAVPPIMGTGAIDLPNQDRIGERNFSLSGFNAEAGGAAVAHIPQLATAIGLHDACATTVFSADFNSPGTPNSTTWVNSGAIGVTAWSVTRNTAEWAGRINSNRLELTNDNGGGGTDNDGWALGSTATTAFTSPYNPILTSNTDPVIWTFNMRQSFNNGEGLGVGEFGLGFILAGTADSDENSGSGYAVIMGEFASDPLRLVRYSGGLNGTTTNIVTSNTTGLTDVNNDYVSVRVVYDPVTEVWELLARNDGGSAFTDPNTGILLSQGTGVNSTSTGTSLPLMAGYMSGRDDDVDGVENAYFDNISVTVGNCSVATTPVVTPPANQNSNEGSSTAFSLGSFVDPDGGPWTVTVNWGDASPNTVFNAAAAGSLGTQNHTYAQNGVYTVTVTVADSGALSDSDTFQVTVANVSPANVFRSIAPGILNENGSISVDVSFTDPGVLDTHTVTISWGDGSPNTVTNLAAGVLSVTGVTHQYLDDNPTGTAADIYSVVVTVADGDGGSAPPVPASVTVNNVAPSAIVLNLSSATINENGSTNLSGSFADPGTLDTHTVSINWGDGSAIQTLNLGAGVTTIPSTAHTYLDDNPSGTASDVYTITVTVTDDDTGAGSNTTSVTVNNVAPSGITLNGPFTINEGGSVTLTGSFTDPGTLDPHLVTIDWGDGTAPASFGMAAGVTTFPANAFFTHTYLDDNPTGTSSDVYTITVTVADDDLGSGNATRSVTVNNVNPTATFTNGGPYVCGQDGTVTFSNQADPSAADLAGLRYSYDFDNNGTWEVGNGVYGGSVVAASATVPANPYLLPPGNHTVKGRVLDDDLGLNDYTTVIVVNKANTTTTVTASPVSPSTFGQPVTFTATIAVVAPGMGTPTGTVSFNIDGNIYCANTPLVGLTATCTQAGLPALPAGVRNVVAVYSGDTCFNFSAGTLNYTVNKANTTTAILNDTPDPSLVNQPYTVTWSVTAVAPGAGTPTGTVTVNGGTGGGSCTAPVAAGGCQLTPTTIGVKTISATYNGDNNFNTSTSSTTSHTVNVQISGLVRNGVTLAPASGVTMTLTGCASGNGTTTTNAAGQYSFTGQIVGPCQVYPGPVSEPYVRLYATVLTNITNADFLIYPNAADHPRRVTYPTQFVVPGAAGSMPVMMNSLGNEATVAFSFTYDPNPFSQPPVVVCGANAPGCTVTQNNTVFGKVGVTIAPVGGVFTRPDGTPLEGPEAAGANEIARINFQTVASTTLPSTDFVLGNTPTAAALTETGTGNPLFANFIEPARVVFAQGIEADVTGRNTGNGVVDSTDLTQIKRFVTGLDTPVLTHNEFQRADSAPASTKGNGVLDATDVIQTRRYLAGLDGAQSAGGPGLAIPVMAPAAERPDAEADTGKTARAVSIGSTQGTTNSRISVPVSLNSTGDETAMSFTLRYDETRLTSPNVALTANAAEGTLLTYNAEEPGIIRILIDGTRTMTDSRGAQALIELTFDVTGSAPSGDTELMIEDATISDARANALTARYTAGRISIAGPNPTDEKGARPARRTQRPEEFDIIQEWTRENPISILRRREQ